MSNIRTFSAAGLAAGARSALPLVPGVVAFGVAFGVLAGQKGLSSAEAALMSLIVCAGTAQFAALQTWADPAPVLAAAIASLALNSRYVLLGAATRPWFVGLGPLPAYGSLFFLFDQNFALAAREQVAGRYDAAHMMGGGLLLCTVWTFATGIGHIGGTVIGDVSRLGLDFVILAFFAALLVELFRGRSDVTILAVAIPVAIATERLVPGPWYMITGALAGSAVAAFAGPPPATRSEVRP
jgi:4-azaleucine resistance transporter AzlC